MNPLVHFRWYRRWRGGVWGRHSALLHNWKTWTRFDYMPADFSARLGDEDWRTTTNTSQRVLSPDTVKYWRDQGIELEYASPQRSVEPLTDEQIEGLRGLDTASRVRFYEHDFYVLSNFSAFSLKWQGRRFPTSEHAYHWEKFKPGTKDEHGLYVRDHILMAESAHAAFKMAEAWKPLRRPDWDSVKVDIMLGILREKARQHEYVRRKLLATGDRELVEDSWRDDFWGWGPNRDGKNMLGTLWMQVRAELREQDQ